MLYRILEAYSGQLPADIHAVFANTGREREETLRFVHKVSVQWQVPIHWVEWRNDFKGFEEVRYDWASRNGEPFAELIRKRHFCPNAVARFCTTKLKIEPMRGWMRANGYDRWDEAIGLRDDEGMRILKAMDRNASDPDGPQAIMPLVAAKVTKRDVAEFWARHPFQLELEGHEGNCDLCFLKARRKLTGIIRKKPELAAWWIEREREVSGWFVTEYSYSDLLREVRAQGDLFDGWLEDDEHDVECGLLCAAE